MEGGANPTESGRGQGSSAENGGDPVTSVPFQEVADQCPVPVFVHRDGRILYCNPAGAGLLAHRSPETLVSQQILDFFPPESREVAAEHFRAVFERKEPQPLGTRIRRLDGVILDVEITSFVANHEGELTLHSMTLDVTERKRMEADLRQSQKMETVGRMAGGIAHDFNNLLNIVGGNASLARKELPLDSPVVEDLIEIEKAVDRAASLTNQLLAFSRRQLLEPRVLDLNQEVAGTSSMLGRVIGEHIELVTELLSAGAVCVDPGQINQVLMNLAVNARDAMPGGGRLTVRTADVELTADEVHRYPFTVVPGRYVLLTVADTGTGISAEVQSHIFEPFFTTKRAGEGTGLGLATVYGIVKQSGGFIAVDSAVGEGTTFQIHLPRVEHEAEREAAPRNEALPSGRGETLLVVEDEEGLRVYLRRVLQRLGYNPLMAASGEEALQIFTESAGAIRLVLTDVVMPGISGTELVQRLGELEPSLPVLYMTGYTEDAIVHHGIQARGINVLHKPFKPDELARNVREALDGA